MLILRGHRAMFKEQNIHEIHHEREMFENVAVNDNLEK